MKKVAIWLLALCAVVALSCVAMADDHTCTYWKTVDIEKPSCVNGWEKMECIDCGAIRTDVLEATDPHEYGAETIVDTKDGYVQYSSVCKKCGNEKLEWVATSPEVDCTHDWVWAYIPNVDTLPTCTAKGTMHRRCELCHKVTDSMVVNPLGHNWTAKWYGRVEPTCTEAGSQYKYCNGHDYTLADGSSVHMTCSKHGGEAALYAERKYEEIPALGHDFTGPASAESDPTCLQAGSKTVKCSRCPVVDVITKPALGHLWDVDGDGKLTADQTNAYNVKQPSCFKAGSFELYCDRPNCPVTHKVEIPAYGTHLFDKDFTESLPLFKAPTCGTWGYYYKICERCGAELTMDISKVEPLGGCEAKIVETLVKPTCTNPGSARAVCKACGTSMGVITLPAAHDWSAWSTPEYAPGKAACGYASEQYRTCAVCKAKETRVVPATGDHRQFGSKEIAPTCLSAGMTQTYCVDCGFVANVAVNPDVPALGHNWITVRVTKVASCTEEGAGFQSCDRKGCDQKMVEFVIPKAPHEFTANNWKQVDATCEKPGFAYIPCNLCGQVVETKDTYAPLNDSKPLGHNPVVTTTDATCTEAGKTVTACSRCNTVISEVVIDALGHNMVEVKTVEETCTQNGYVLSECSRCGKAETEVLKAGHDWGITMCNRCKTPNPWYKGNTVAAATKSLVFTADNTATKYTESVKDGVATITAGENGCVLKLDAETVADYKADSVNEINFVVGTANVVIPMGAVEVADNATYEVTCTNVVSVATVVDGVATDITAEAAGKGVYVK